MRVLTHSFRCQAHPEKNSQKKGAPSFRDRLQSNPAYQRQKEAAWKDAYQPGGGKPTLYLAFCFAAFS